MSFKEVANRLLSGKAVFTDDISIDSMICGHTIRSPIPKGRIVSIHVPKLPDNMFYAESRMIPGERYLSVLKEKIPYLAENNVSYIGEPVLLLAGPDKNHIEAFAQQIVIEYKEEEPEFSLDTIHEENILDCITYSKGDFSGLNDPSFKQIEDTYFTGTQEHLYAEPQCTIAEWKDDGVTIHSSTLFPFHVRDNVALFLGIPRKKVRVIVPAVSSPFGGKMMLPTIIAAHAALLSLVSKKPVKLLYTRDEDISYTYKRHPARIYHKMIINTEGCLTGAKAEIVFDAGAYQAVSSNILRKAANIAFGMYSCEHIELTAKLVRTNKIPSGYFSGTGELQALFGLELHTYRLSQMMQIDPSTWKRDNLLSESKKHHQLHIPEFISSPLAVLDEAVRISDFRRKYGAYQAIKGKNKIHSGFSMPLRGIGIALCPHIIDDAADDADDKGADIYAVTLRLGKDHKCTILTSLVDMGGSKLACFSAIVAKKLNINPSAVSMEKIDTDIVPDTGPSISARTVHLAGRCIELACESIKRKMKKNTFPVEVKKRIEFPRKTGKAGSPLRQSLTWEAAVVEVEMDPFTLTTTCKGIWIVLDPGPILNYGIAREHVEAAALQNFGYASMEMMDIKNGKVIQNTISEYTTPDITSVPEIDVRFIQHKEQKKTGLIRGLGDQAVIGVAPAYIAALNQATGIHLNHVPCIPEQIQELMKNDSQTRENIRT